MGLDFGVISILEHHFTGVLTGTFAITPNASSLSKPSLTDCCQLIGMVAGDMIAVGVA